MAKEEKSKSVGAMSPSSNAATAGKPSNAGTQKKQDKPASDRANKRDNAEVKNPTGTPAAPDKEKNKTADASQKPRRNRRSNEKGRGSDRGKQNKERTAQKPDAILLETVAHGRLSSPGKVVSLATFREIDQIIRRDSVSLATAEKREAYWKRNRWQYYYGINTWLYLIQDICGLDAPMKIDYLAQLMLSHGLVWVIRRCCDYAQQLVSEQEEPHPMAAVVAGLPLQQQLQVLRFLKRFTPLEADNLNEAAVNKWVAVENDVRAWHRHNEGPNDPRTILLRQIKQYISVWFKAYRPLASTDAWLLGTKIPTGACLGKRFSAPADRIVLLASAMRHPRHRYLCPFPTSLERVDRMDTSKWTVFDRLEVEAAQALRYYCTGSKTTHSRANRLVTVPKTYKSPRIVCPEAVINQLMQRTIRDKMLVCAPKWVRDRIPVEDQTVMEELARKAFALGLTTTDLSHASDSLATGAIMSCFPAVLARDLDNWRPTHTYLPDRDRPRRLEQFSTMGTGNVWYVMAVFLLACMCVACDNCGVSKNRKNLCHAFGDDMIHPDEITEELYYELELLGFEVNRDKSFGTTSRYRESCGSEWWKEDDGTVTSVRTLYYPRFPIHCTDSGAVKNTLSKDYDPLRSEAVLTDTLSRFVAMQHAFYAARYHNANRFLVEAIRTMCPIMTISRATTQICLEETTDMAGDFTIAAKIRRPMKGRGASGTYVDPDSMLEYHVNERAGHASPVMCIDDAERSNVVAEWLYFQYLIFGPKRHSDPVLAMIGCTEPRSVAAGDPSIDWKVR